MIQPPTRRSVLHGAWATVTLAACGERARESRASSLPAGEPPGQTGTGLPSGGVAVDGPGDGSLLDTGWADTGIAPPTCSVTSPFAEGPYFLSDAPDRSDLRAAASSAGTDFTLELTIRSEVDCIPLAGAIVELWHCDPDGDYDMTTDDMMFRCRVRTDFAGRVVLTTYKPVPYPLEGEDRWMPAHFHLKVFAAGHNALTTQLRFVGDPYDDGTLPTSLMLTSIPQADGSEAAAYTITLAVP